MWSLYQCTCNWLFGVFLGFPTCFSSILHSMGNTFWYSAINTTSNHFLHWLTCFRVRFQGARANPSMHWAKGKVPSGQAIPLWRDKYAKKCFLDGHRALEKHPLPTPLWHQFGGGGSVFNKAFQDHLKTCTIISVFKCYPISPLSIIASVSLCLLVWHTILTTIFFFSITWLFHCFPVNKNIFEPSI